MASTGGDPNVEPDYLRRQLQSMDDYDFEHFVADLWERQGWDTEVEQQSMDAGVDIRATKTDPYRKKALIQAKRYSDGNSVGGRAIQQYSALKQQEPDTDEAIIVTTSRFTGPAEERARELNVKLIDGDDLVALIDKLDAQDLLYDYVDRLDPAGDGSAFQFTEQERRKLESVSGKDFDEFVKAEQRRTSQALRDATTKVRLSPADAADMGMFDEIPGDGFVEQFSNEQKPLVFLKEDVHLDENGMLYVEDLSQYVDSSRINGPEEENILGIIDPAVPDGAWTAEDTDTSTVTKQLTGSLDRFWAPIPGAASDRNWIRVTLWSLLVSWLAFMATGAGAGSVGALLWMGSVATCFVTFWKDLKSVRRSISSWYPSPRVWLLLSLFTGGLCIGVYLYKRRQAVEEISASS